MTVAGALLLYVAIVLVAGPRLLRRITTDGGAPRVAIAAWLTAVVTVLGCSVAAIALLLIEAAGHWDTSDQLLESCFERLQAILGGQAGTSAMIVAASAVTLTIGLFAAIGVRFARVLGRMRSQTFAHANAVRMVGRSRGDGVVVIDAAEPAAYCVTGQPPAIVVTSGAVATLDSAQLAAVVAHERAHLDGRHAYVVAVVRGLAAALPKVSLFENAATQISSLLEMCADDAAARRHGSQPLLGGLLALSSAGRPTHSLAAAGVAVLLRAQRLTNPRNGRTRIRARMAASGAVAAMAGAPFTITALAFSGALACFA